jgi:hypothetical protein
VSDEDLVRRGVALLRRMAYVRQPPYELPPDSFLELAVREIVRLAREEPPTLPGLGGTR